MTARIWSDPIVDEIHRIRQEIAKEAGNDLHTHVLRLQQSQNRHAARRVRGAAPTWPKIREVDR